jgi:predicted aspartyl protease
MRATVGGASGNFVVSDDLPHIVVTRAFAARAGLAVAETPAITILLDGGLETAAVAEVSRVELGQLSAAGFEAAVVDAIAGVGKQPTDGVIGLDFTWRFESVWQDGKMALEPLRIAL